jgi:uncharacterized membrane protein YgcG
MSSPPPATKAAEALAVFYGRMTEALVLRALSDPGFAARLQADPRAVLETELGIPLPEGLQVQVHENTAGSLHLVLPPLTRTGPLTEQELAQATGGAGFGGGSFSFGGSGFGFGGGGFGFGGRGFAGS